MPRKRDITQLGAATRLAPNDVLHAVDKSDTSVSSRGKDVNITVADLKGDVSPSGRPVSDNVVRASAGADAYPSEPAADSLVVDSDYTLSDATTVTFSALTLKKGWHAVGCLVTGGQAPTMTVTFDGNNVATPRAASENALEATYGTPQLFEDGYSFFVSAETTADVVVTLSSAHLQGALVRKFDPTTGVVADVGDNFSSGPESVEAGGRVFSVVHDMYDQRGFVTDNCGTALQVFDAETSGIFINDKWHAPACLVDLGNDQLLAVRTRHAQDELEIRLVDISDGTMATSGAVREIGGTFQIVTYCMALRTADGKVHILTRGVDDLDDDNPTPAFNNCRATRYQIDDPTDPAGTTYEVDTVSDSLTRWHYPRLWKLFTRSDGEEVIVAGWSIYNTNAGALSWDGIAGAVYDPSANKWYSLNGTAAPNNSANGTSEDPRFADTWVINLTSAGTGYMLTTSDTSKQRQWVQGCAVADVVQWPSEGNPKAALGALVTDATQTDSEVAASTAFDWISFDGTTETETALAGVTSANYWAGGASFQGGYGSGVIVFTDMASVDTDQKSETILGYFQWGGTTLRGYQVSNGYGADPVFTNIRNFTVSAGRNCWCNQAVGPYLCVHYADNQAHGNHAQAQRTWYDMRNFGAAAGDNVATGTVTARSGDIDFSGGSDGDVLTVQAGGELSLETPSSGGDVSAASAFTTDNAVITADTVSGSKNVQQTNIEITTGVITTTSGGLNIVPKSSVLAIGTLSSTLGQRLQINRGSTAENPGTLVLYDDAGNDYFLWVDTAGNLRLHTAYPTDEDADGTVLGAGGGDSWGDAVDADIVPDADGTRDLGATATRFAETYTDALDVTNNVTVGGTVDGRDVAADGTKLDTVESNADVTDTANVTSAGALMDSEVTNLAQVKAFDSSDYATAAQGTTADAAVPAAGGTMTGKLQFSGTTYAPLELLSLTTTERDALTPVNGDLIYNETAGEVQGYMGGVWTNLGAGAGGGISNVVEDTTPQLGGDLDCNGFDLQLDDGNGLRDDSGNEYLVLQKNTTAVNHVEVTNAATGNDPSIGAAGDDAAVNLLLNAKGSGTVQADGVTVADISSAQTLTNKTLSTGTALGTPDSGTLTNCTGLPTAGLVDEAVTNAKLAHMAQSTIKGRAAGAGTGDATDLTAAQARTILNVEDGSTADQTDAEIRTAVENATDSNVFTDDDHTKLNGIETAADVTDATNVAAAGAVMQDASEDVDGIEYLERADHPNTPAATKGQDWVKSGTVQERMFTDDAGNDMALGKMWYSLFLGDNDYEPTAAGTRVQWRVPAACKIWAVAAGCQDAPVGAALQMDVEDDGTTIITGTLEILLTTTSDDGGHSITVPTAVAADSLIDFDVDQAVTSGATGVHIDLLISWD